jgi:hypothetical protein
MSRRVRWWLTVCGLPLLLAAISWLLGGNAIWGWVTGITGFLLFLFVLSSLKYLPQMQVRHYLLFGLIILNWACFAAVGYYFPLLSVSVRTRTDEAKLPTRVYYEGKEVASLDSSSEKATFPLRGRLEKSSVKIEVLGPQGWVARKFDVYGNDIVLDRVPTAFLYIDNKGHKAVDLACGALTLQVGADGRESYEFLALPEGKSFPMNIDGKEVGVVNSAHTLIDVEGTRTYRLRHIVYQSGLGLALALDPNHAADHLPPPDDSFAGKHVHKLPGKVDYVFTAAPEKITVHGFQGMMAQNETRTELLPVD